MELETEQIDEKIAELEEELANENRFFMRDGLYVGLKLLRRYKRGEVDEFTLKSLVEGDPRNHFSWPAKAMCVANKNMAQFILELIE